MATAEARYETALERLTATLEGFRKDQERMRGDLTSAHGKTALEFVALDIRDGDRGRRACRRRCRRFQPLRRWWRLTDIASQVTGPPDCPWNRRAGGTYEHDRGAI